MRLLGVVVGAACAWVGMGTAAAQPYEPPPPPAAVFVPPGEGAVAPPPDRPEGIEPCVAPCFDTVLPARPGTARLDMLGLRVGATDANTFNMSAAFAGRAAESRAIGFTNDRATLFFVLGGGGAGFEGAFGGSLAAGVRAPIDRVSGVVIRAGLEGYILGNHILYASMFELPQGQIAYQLMRSDAFFELGGKSGAVLTGRLRHPLLDGERRIPLSAEWGAYASAHFRPLRLDVSYTRIEARSDAIGAPLDVVDGDLCGLIGPIALCTDVRFERGAVAVAGGGVATGTSLFQGLTVGPRLGPDVKRRERREPREEASR